jgi:hypothetical protein
VPAEEKRFYDRERLTGRSLSMREYLDRALWWMDRQRLEEPFDSEDDRRASLREAIVDFEQRRLLERVASGESFDELERESAGGRWE